MKLNIIKLCTLLGAAAFLHTAPALAGDPNQQDSISQDEGGTLPDQNVDQNSSGQEDGVTNPDDPSGSIEARRGHNNWRNDRHHHGRGYYGRGHYHRGYYGRGYGYGYYRPGYCWSFLNGRGWGWYYCR